MNEREKHNGAGFSARTILEIAQEREALMYEEQSETTKQRIRDLENVLRDRLGVCLNADVKPSDHPKPL